MIANLWVQIHMIANQWEQIHMIANLWDQIHVIVNSYNDYKIEEHKINFPLVSPERRCNSSCTELRK